MLQSAKLMSKKNNRTEEAFEFRKVIFEDASSSERFLLYSGVMTQETGKWDDGIEYPLYKVEVSSASHPFYTGKEASLDRAGRADQFRKRAAKAIPVSEGTASSESIKPAKGETPTAKTEE